MGQYRYDAKVTRVVDGDTIDCIVDLGFKISIAERFRLYGVDTPESRTRDKEEKKRGLAAKEFVKHRIQSQNVEIDVTKGQGKYGRYLATVYYFVDDIKINLNKELVEHGHAVRYFGGKRSKIIKV